MSENNSSLLYLTPPLLLQTRSAYLSNRMAIRSKRRLLLYFIMGGLISFTILINFEKIMETNRILHTIENWDQLNEEAQKEVERLHFIYEVESRGHDHDETDEEHDHENMVEDEKGRLIQSDDSDSKSSSSNQKDENSSQNNNSPIDQNQPKFGFFKQPAAGDGSTKAELERLYNYLMDVNDKKNPETEAPYCKKFDYIGTDKKYFVDFSYPICMDEEIWMAETDTGAEVVYDDNDNVVQDSITTGASCIVYSFGNDNNWNFEESLVQDNDCGVFAFDPNLYDLEDGEKSTGILFKKYGIGDTNSESVLQRGKRDYLFKEKLGEEGLEAARKKPMRTIWGIMQELEHTNRVIDIVKIDREGPRLAYETTALKNLLEDGTYRCIKQIVVELHLFGPVKYVDHIRTTYSVLKGLEEVGMILWRVQPSKSKSKLDDVQDLLALENDKSTFMFSASFINQKPMVCS